MIRAVAALALLFTLMTSGVMGARIKDVVSIEGSRDNQLIGYGLVVGLSGSGDSLRGSPFTEQSLRSMLRRMGVSVPQGSMRARNVAAVVVTATLPPFIGKGARIDVTVSSLGDATSLSGGTLLLTPLVAVDGNAYAVAQGPLVVSGFAASGDAQKLTQGVPTAGRIANGAIIERELAADFNAQDHLVLQLLYPDFGTAVAIADQINRLYRKRYSATVAQARDLRTVVVKRPQAISATRMMAEIGELPIDPKPAARIILDEKTGTIVIGGGVRVSKVAVTHGSLTVRIAESPQASQPQPLSNGETVIEPDTEILTREDGGQLSVVSGTSLEKLVDGLNRLGVKPSGIIAILQAIKSAGALQGDLVVQ